MQAHVDYLLDRFPGVPPGRSARIVQKRPSIAIHYIDFAPCAAEHRHHTIMRNDPFWVRVLCGKVEPAHDVKVRRSIKSVTQLCTAIDLGDLLSQVRVVSDARLLAIASSFLREPDGIALFSSHYFCKQAGTGQVTATAVRPRSGLRALPKNATNTLCSLYRWLCVYGMHAIHTESLPKGVYPLTCGLRCRPSECYGTKMAPTGRSAL